MGRSTCSRRTDGFVLVLVSCWVLLWCRLLGDVLPDGGDVERSGQAQGPGERPPLVGQVDAGRVGVHGCTPARPAPAKVDDQEAVVHHDTQQRGLRCPDPTADACALRARDADHGRV